MKVCESRRKSVKVGKSRRKSVKVGESRRKSVKVGDEEKKVFLSMISGNPFLSDFKLVKKPVCFGSRYNYKLDSFVKKSFIEDSAKAKRSISNVL